MKAQFITIHKIGIGMRNENEIFKQKLLKCRCC